jgi:hypothetical protein
MNSIKVSNIIGALLIIGASASRVALRDVPVGECHGCEVTCFEDCSLKYSREIMADDFIQLPPKPENKTARKPTAIGMQLMDCLKEEECPCPKEQAKLAMNGTAKNGTAKNGTAFVQAYVQNATCAVLPEGATSCAQGCAEKVMEKAHAKLEKKKSAKVAKKQVFLEKDYPVHSVSVGVFSRGAMNMDQCLKFCLAATCGCDKAPGLDSIDKLFDAIKQNDAALPGEKDFSHRDEPATAVADTHGSYRFRPAQVEECAKGMIGKKVAKGLYIDMGGGVGGEIEICSKELMERIFGPGDHSEKEKLCKSSKIRRCKVGLRLEREERLLRCWLFTKPSLPQEVHGRSYQVLRSLSAMRMPSGAVMLSIPC